MKQTIKKLFIFLVIFIISMVTLQNIALSEEKYEFERMWPELQQPWYFNGPHGIAIDSGGSVYVANYYNNNIQKFNSDGGFITNWGIQGNDNGEFEGPRGIAADKNGNIYVVDSGNNRIQKFSSDGVFDTEWGKFGSDNGDFNNPHGIAADGEGNVYVADSFNHRIQKFDSDGNFIKEWGTQGSGNGEFNNPTGIATDTSSNIYVVDKNNYRVQKFSKDGNFIIKWGSKGSGDGQFNNLTAAIAVDKSGYVYIAEGSDTSVQTIGNHRVQKFTSYGDFIDKWGNFGPSDGEFFYPRGIAVDEKGKIYVTDYKKNNIQKFDSSGAFIITFIITWGASGFGDGQFNIPGGIASDKDGNIYVVDFGNHRIQKFSPDGIFIEKWGDQGTGDGQFDLPSGIAIDENGNFYVSECRNNRIQKFSSDGNYIKKWGSPGGLWGGEFNCPLGITVGSDGNIYVADMGNNRIQKFTPAGEFIAMWGGIFSTFGGKFNSPADIAADNAGNIYVVEYGSHRVQKLSTEGLVITKWGSLGTGDGQFNTPSGIAVDENGNVYVADTKNKRIQKFTSEGKFITKFGDDGLLMEPCRLYVSNTGNVYVSDDFSHSVQVFKRSDSSGTDDKISKAIIVAGGGPFSNNLWNATQMCVNYAYRALLYQGYDKEAIYYLSHYTDVDVDGNREFDDVDNNSTNSNLEYAITEWAAKEDTDDLFIYITDHGGEGIFVMGHGEHLSASDLDSWLDTVQGIIPGKVVLVYDACHSGSFIPLLKPPEGKSRIVLTSTKPNQESVFAAQGKVSFSFTFWANMFNGDSFYNSYIDADRSIQLSYITQNPQLDANGNGIPNEEDDKILTRDNVQIGNEILSAGDLPFIGSFGVSPETLNGETSAVIYAENVIDANGISKVWAVIKPPEYTAVSPDDPVLDLPVLDLEPKGNNRYEATYNHFDHIGTYNIAIYATDKRNVIIDLPKQTTVIQTQGTQPDIIAVPTFSPEPGNYTASQTVTLSCITEGVIIRYTTDGSEPTEYSAGYTDPISISETTTIKAKAYKTDEESGNTATGIYTFIIKGDINGDGTTDMEDAMIALKVAAGLDTFGMIRPDYSESLVDVNGGNKIGLEEVVYILSKLAGLRE